MNTATRIEKWQDAEALKAELYWLKEIITLRAEALDKAEMDTGTLPDIAPPPQLPASHYRNFIEKHNLHIAERLLLAVCLFRVYRPVVFAPLMEAKEQHNIRLFSETGVFFERHTGAALPSLFTVIFLLAGCNDEYAAQCVEILNEKSQLTANGVIKLNTSSAHLNDRVFNLVSLDKSYYAHFLYGKKIRLDEMENFPAQLLETTKTFDDLVLAADVKSQLKNVMNYARHYRAMHQKTGGALQGYVAMFYGPPGTGKTMTASVIGKELGMDVYVVNLSRVISKYIGETEKNLEVVFDRLGNRECILFFDEADALFGKRSEVTEANDRYANQEIAYLLQKIDKCNCLVMLATNFRQNLDFAFTRRILSYIKIDWPGNGERELLWQKALVPPFSYAPENLPGVMAQKYAITGANIANVIKLACYEALANDTCQVTAPMLETFIKLEYMKEKRNPNDPGNWPVNQMN